MERVITKDHHSNWVENAADKAAKKLSFGDLCLHCVDVMRIAFEEVAEETRS